MIKETKTVPFGDLGGKSTLIFYYEDHPRSTMDMTSDLMGSVPLFRYGRVKGYRGEMFVGDLCPRESLLRIVDYRPEFCAKGKSYIKYGGSLSTGETVNRVSVYWSCQKSHWC